jgi:hypothetical protein
MSGFLDLHDNTTTSQTAALPTVPDHLIEVIIEYIERYSDSLALAVTCKSICLAAQPILIRLQFRTISLTRIDNNKLWDALLEKPGLSRSVRHILLASLENELPEGVRCPRSYAMFDPGVFKWSPAHFEHFCRALSQLPNLTQIIIRGRYGVNWFPHGADEVWRAIKSGCHALSSMSIHDGVRLQPGGSPLVGPYIRDEQVDHLIVISCGFCKLTRSS